MKDIISRRFKELTALAILAYAAIWALINWYTGDLLLASIATLVLVIADLAVLAYIYREELSERFRRVGSKE